MARRAVIVGVSHYSEPGWNVDPPARNALAVARWALGSGGFAPSEVFVFVSALNDSVVTALKDLGVLNVKPARREEVETFLRAALAPNQGVGDLFFYWSGHGMADTDGRRMFFYEDFRSADLNDRIFNASLFLRDLRTEKFAAFERGLVVADACGNYSDIEIRPPDYRVREVFKKDLRAFLAAQEGDTTIATTDEDGFTSLALKALSRMGKAVDTDAFEKALIEEAARYVGRSFEVWQDTDAKKRPMLVGRFEYGSSAANELIALLIAAGQDFPTIYKQYLATANEVGNPGLLRAANGISSMVHALDDLNDVGGRPTEYLIQFALRLSESKVDLKRRLNPWLEAHQRRRPDVYVAQKTRLENEKERKLLLLEIESDRVDGVTGVKPYLRYRADLSRVERARLTERIATAGWDEVQQAVLSILDGLKKDGLANDLELHFLIGPSALDRAFHLLVGPKGRPLGREYPATLHYAPRVVEKRSRERRKWETQVAKLEGVLPCDFAWAEVGLIEDLPSEAGIYFANFVVSPESHNDDTLEALNGLLDMGAPYVYWRHSPAQTQCRAKLEAQVKSLKVPDDMPEKLLDLRISSRSNGWGSLLWDSSNFRPFG